MAKRFIDTNIFKKGFLKSLPPSTKLFYVYLFCECDHYGIWNVELDVAEVRLGISLDYTYVLDLLSDKIIEIEKGRKWFLPQFILFQYGTLNPKHKLHRSVFNELEKRNLLQYVSVPEELGNSSGRVKEKDKEKDKEKEKDKDKEKETAQISFIAEENTEVEVLLPESIENSAKRRKNGKKDEVYHTFISVYSDFLKKRGIPVKIGAVDGKALKELIKYIGKMDSVLSGRKTEADVFRYVLDNWNRLNAWTQTQVQMRQINSQIPNIIEQLRNGKQNNQTNTTLDLANALRNKIQGSTGTEFNSDNG